ncbi:MAG: hypothetical protein IPP27_06675 [Bacteroidetes bacterium]|nr:hypothetical protein [Bacteroidota bacterium]MBK9412065.1 hypothetical protein [Bacteroidota bacterium]MBL0031873.1 hypothetical protein [Bacteroidota bacterium]
MQVNIQATFLPEYEVNYWLEAKIACGKYNDEKFGGYKRSKLSMIKLSR